VVKNEVTQESYCLTKDGSVPSGCNDATTITGPATAVGVYDDNIDVVPFLEVKYKLFMCICMYINTRVSYLVKEISLLLQAPMLPHRAVSSLPMALQPH
jgi:hypothetical protein